MKLPSLLLIAGTGRNSGKTTLACRIIQKFCSRRPIIALKISQHGHIIEPGGRIITRAEGMHIEEETNAGTRKDSSRMLAAGAIRSFFLAASGNRLLEAFQQIADITGRDACYVCESGGLREWIEPGLFLVVTSTRHTNVKPAAMDLERFEHTRVTFDGLDFGFNINRIAIQGNCWEMKPDYDII